MSAVKKTSKKTSPSAPKGRGSRTASKTAVKKLAPVKKAGTVKKSTAKKTASKKTAARNAVSPRSIPKALADARRQMNKKRKPRAQKKEIIHAIFAALQKAMPEPQGELDYVNPYTLLVAVVLSAQATDTGVNRATKELFRLADTPQKMIALGEDRVRDLVKTIGLYRNKAKNVIALSEKLIGEFGGEIPRTRAELETLPGVGRKTANVVLNIAFGEETIAVDTHLFRLSNRLRLAPGKTPLEVELGLEKAVPAEFRRHAHHWLILHGRYICKAIKPECEKCVVAEFCSSGDKRI